jgi:hypothetical protein
MDIGPALCRIFAAGRWRNVARWERTRLYRRGGERGEGQRMNSPAISPCTRNLRRERRLPTPFMTAATLVSARRKRERYRLFPGCFAAAPDLLPGIPFTPLSAPAAPDGLAAGPDLLPDTPGVPGFEVPPAPGALSSAFWLPGCFAADPDLLPGIPFTPLSSAPAAPDGLGGRARFATRHSGRARLRGSTGTGGVVLGVLAHLEGVAVRPSRLARHHNQTCHRDSREREFHEHTSAVSLR